MNNLKSTISELFPDLAVDSNFIDEFDESIRVRTYSKGELIIDYGTYLTHVPLVLDGILKVLREKDEEREVLLYFLEGGNTCAASFSCCMIKKRSEIKVISDTSSKIAYIPLETVNNWISKYEVWRNFIFRMYEQRLTTLIDTIDHLAFSKLDGQLLNYLESRAQISTDHIIRISHAHIASDLSVSRESISRLLKKLESLGRVELGRNKITLIN